MSFITRWLGSRQILTKGLGESNDGAVVIRLIGVESEGAAGVIFIEVPMATGSVFTPLFDWVEYYMWNKATVKLKGVFASSAAGEIIVEVQSHIVAEVELPGVAALSDTGTLDIHAVQSAFAYLLSVPAANTEIGIIESLCGSAISISGWEIDSAQGEMQASAVQNASDEEIIIALLMAA